MEYYLNTKIGVKLYVCTKKIVFNKKPFYLEMIYLASKDYFIALKNVPAGV